MVHARIRIIILKRTMYLFILLCIFAPITSTAIMNENKPGVVGVIENITPDQIRIVYYDKNILKGKKLFSIKQGYRIVEFEVQKTLEKQRAAVKIVSGTPNSLILGEKIFNDITSINKNRETYKNLFKDIKKYRISSDYKALTLISQSEKLVNNNKIWDGIKTYIKVLKSTIDDDEIKAKAFYKMAMAFYKDQYENNQEGKNDLRDIINCREILLYITKKYEEDMIWVQRANLKLAFLYSNNIRSLTNKIMFQYMIKSGDLGNILLHHGINILSTMPKDSILIANGEDFQNYILQFLTQNGTERPDITIYDRKGNLFDNIYGNLEDLPQEKRSEKIVNAEKIIITEKKPPPDTVVRSSSNREHALHVRKGKIFYLQMDTPTLDLINEQLYNDNKPLYHFENIGILYQIVEEDNTIMLPAINQIWKWYEIYYYNNDIIYYPNFIKKIMTDHLIQYGDHYLHRLERQYFQYITTEALQEAKWALAIEKKKDRFYNRYQRYLHSAYNHFNEANQIGKDMNEVLYEYAIRLQKKIEILSREQKNTEMNDIIDEAISSALNSLKYTGSKNFKAKARHLAVGLLLGKATLNPQDEIELIEQALSYLNEVIKLNPSDKSYTNSINRAKGMKKIHISEILALERELDDDLKNYDLIKEIAEKYIERYDYNNAIAILLEAKKSILQNKNLLFLLARTYLLNEQYIESLLTCNSWVIIQPADPRAYYYMAANNYILGNLAEAHLNYTKFLIQLKNEDKIDDLKPLINIAKQKIKELTP